MNKKQFLLLTSVAVLMTVILLTKTIHSNTVQSRTIVAALQGDTRTATVRVRYALALSYFDQISNAARRVQSHQCWAAKMGGSKIVEPFVVDTSYLGGLLSDMDASNATRFRDLFDLEHWNRRSIESSLPPLISWEEFLQTATRQVILVRINWRQLFKNEPFRCERQDLEQLRTFWTRFLKPHGFKIFRELCVDLKKRSELTKVIVDQNSYIDVTVIIDDWREMIGVRGPSLVTDSNCDKSFGGQTVLNWLKPSLKVMNDTDLYISKYLDTDHKFISVMIRWEIILWRKHMNGHQCMAKILKSVERMQQEKNINLIFMATDAGSLGSDIMARTTRYSMVDPKYRRESLEHTQKILQTIFDPPLSLAEYEQQFQGLQIKNAAYVSIVQKIIAAKAECLLRIPAEGGFQQHALELYESFHTETKCTEEIRRC